MAQKKVLLTLHLAFSAVMLGVAVVFLVVSIRAAAAQEETVRLSCFFVMRILSRTAVVGSTAGAAVTGILLSVRTHWGLLRYYWVIAKEGLTVFSIALGPICMRLVLEDPALVNGELLWTGISLQILSIAAMFVLSVYKPWGRRVPSNRLHSI